GARRDPGPQPRMPVPSSGDRQRRRTHPRDERPRRSGQPTLKDPGDLRVVHAAQLAGDRAQVRATAAHVHPDLRPRHQAGIDRLIAGSRVIANEIVTFPGSSTVVSTAWVTTRAGNTSILFPGTSPSHMHTMNP